MSYTTLAETELPGLMVLKTAVPLSFSMTPAAVSAP
jgi:hypothetical protein